MKTRQGFVSNSSSSSFVISKADLTYEQGNTLISYTASDENVDGWSIYEDGDRISGFTIMNNGAIDKLFEQLKLDKSKIFFEL